MTWIFFVYRHMQDHCWSNKDIWYSQPRHALEHSTQIWLPSHLHSHTTTIQNRYVCSSCHGWFSVLQLSYWSESETRLCSSPNNLHPVPSCYDTETSIYVTVWELIIVFMTVSSTWGISKPKQRLPLHWFLPISIKIMPPFLCLFLKDFSIVLVSIPPCRSYKQYSKDIGT